MKLILSRKGFDSGSGGCPSPIFPDGTMFSLPIPVAEDKITYGELRHVSEDLGVINIGDVVKDLTSGGYGPDSPAHLDPDINCSAYLRKEGWRGLFGQADAAETHLYNKDVEEGDLFLFFGLFREAEQTNDHWSFVRGTSPRHAIWGWLQIGDIYPQVGGDGTVATELPWASHHPHLQYGGDNNTLYAAPADLKIANGSKAAGAGVFPRFDERLVLTEPGQSVSRWKLPRWFYPDGGKPALTYHGDPNRWTRKEGDSEHIYLQSVGRGQEFVLDCDHYPEAIGWASDLIRDFGER